MWTLIGWYYLYNVLLFNIESIMFMYCGDGLLSNCKVHYTTKTVKGHLWIFMCSEPLNLNWSFSSPVARIVFTPNGRRNFNYVTRKEAKLPKLKVASRLLKNIPSVFPFSIEMLPVLSRKVIIILSFNIF